MVAFIDPRQSKIDIAQATGRAMRKSEGTNKTLGYVVVPIFIDSESEEDVEDEVRGTNFEELMAVLNALQEQDQDLVDIIRRLREDRGRGEVFNPKILSEKVEFIGEFVSFWRRRERLGPLSQFVFAAKPLSDFPDPMPAVGWNTRTITLHGDIPKPANPIRDGNSINAGARGVLTELRHK